MKRPPDPIVRPSHYTFSAIEPIDVIEKWQLGFHLGNVLKYLARAGRKGSKLDDLKKARWYLDREIKRMEEDEAEMDGDDNGKSICPECNGIGTSRFSNRPDDYGPHVICLTCRGTGIIPRDR